MKSNSDTDTTTTNVARKPVTPYVCPACRQPVDIGTDTYICTACDLVFPILFGIADFRLASDRYLDLEAERDKAGYLHAFAQTASFDETLNEYYRITLDVPPQQAGRFTSYAQRGIARGELICDALGDLRGSTVLDVGCGTGGFLIAASRRGWTPVGVDIALRWLVVCATRLQELDLSVELICADVGALPFVEGQFSGCVFADLIEHIEEDSGISDAIVTILRPGGRIFLSSANRLALTAYPSAGLVGVGYLPDRVRSAYIRTRRGIDTMRFATPRSARRVRRLLAAAGLKAIQSRPLAIPASDLTGSRRRLEAAYRVLTRVGVLQALMILFGPAFEITAERPL